MVVADSCYSGALTRSSNHRLKISPRARTYINKLVNLRSRTILASGGLEPVTDNGGGGHSVFAKALLDVLCGNSSWMDGTQLFAKVRKRVWLTADQTPQY